MQCPANNRADSRPILSFLTSYQINPDRVHRIAIAHLNSWTLLCSIDKLYTSLPVSAK